MVLSYNEYIQVSEHSEEIEQSRYEKLEDKIDQLARAFYRNSVTVGAAPEEGGTGRPMTDEEIN